MTLWPAAHVRFAVYCAALAAAVGAGCDGPPPGADAVAGVTVWDSAGIEIVESHAPAHPAEAFWTIDAEPEIVLGGSRTEAP